MSASSLGAGACRYSENGPDQAGRNHHPCGASPSGLGRVSSPGCQRPAAAQTRVARRPMSCPSQHEAASGGYRSALRAAGRDSGQRSSAQASGFASLLLNPGINLTCRPANDARSQLGRRRKNPLADPVAQGPAAHAQLARSGPGSSQVSESQHAFIVTR